MITIRKKLFFFVNLPAIVILLLSGLLLFHILKNEFVPLLMNQTEQNAYLAKLSIESWLENKISWTENFAKRNVTKKMDWDLIKNDLKEAVSNQKDFEMFFLAYPDGTAPTTTDAKANIKDREYFKDIFERGYEYAISNMLVSRATGKNIIVIAYAIKDNSNKTIGLFGATVTLDKMHELSLKIKSGKTGYGWIVDGKGMVISHPNKDLVGKLNVFDSKKDGFIGLDEAGKYMINGEQKVCEIVRPDKVKEILFIHNIENVKGWSCGIAIEKNDFFTGVKRLTSIILIIFFAIIVLVSSLISIISYYIVKNINHTIDIAKDLSEGEGDLTIRLKETSNDETLTLAKYFNKFIESLNNMITGIKNITNEIKQVETELNTNMKNSNEAIKSIISNINLIDKKIENENMNINSTLTTVEEIAKNIEAFNKMIENQATSITQASSSIEQMIANINSVSNIVLQNSKNIESLINLSNISKERILKTTELIKNIDEASNGMLEAINVISSIADKTNLLSMNAAIEAAHAGDYGKGFAVVASEIRHLAENSNVQTKNISAVLKNVKSLIENAVQYIKDVDSSYDEVLNGIDLVKKQENEIRNAMEEQQSGSKQILNAIKQLNNITSEIKTGYKEIKDGSNSILNDMMNLNDISQELSKIALDMSNKSRNIIDIIENTNSILKKNNLAVNDINQLINRFKVN